MEWIFHIGSGKTGSSAIQKALLNQSSQLAKYRVKYLGLHFEYIDSEFSCEFRKLSPHVYLREGSGAYESFANNIVEMTSFLAEKGFEKIIWSNESLWDLHVSISKIFSMLRDLGHTVKVVVYLRSHGSWLRSAYFQWAIKHKVANGPVLKFSDWWRKTAINHLNYSRRINDLMEVVDDLEIRNYDQISDVADDFFRRLGLDQFIVEGVRANDRPSPVHMYLYALYNGSLPSSVLPIQLDRWVKQNKVRLRDLESFSWERLFDSSDVQAQINDAVYEDRKDLDHIFRKRGLEKFGFDTEGPEPPAISQDAVNMFFMAMIRSQSEKINSLETQINALLGKEPQGGGS